MHSVTVRMYIDLVMPMCTKVSVCTGAELGARRSNKQQTQATAQDQASTSSSAASSSSGSSRKKGGKFKTIKAQEAARRAAKLAGSAAAVATGSSLFPYQWQSLETQTSHKSYEQHHIQQESRCLSILCLTILCFALPQAQVQCDCTRLVCTDRLTSSRHGLPCHV